MANLDNFSAAAEEVKADLDLRHGPVSTTWMKTVAVVSQKGGVGKTTLALNLGYALSRRGWRTLIVDADPQGAIGLSLSKKVSQSPGLFEYLTARKRLQDLVVKTRIPELALLSVGRIRVAEAAWFRSTLSAGEGLQRLFGEASGHYDIVLVDTPGGLGPASVGVLRSCFAAISPVQAEPIAVRSIPQLLDVLGWVRETGVNVRLLGLVLSMLQIDDAASRSVAEELWNLFPRELLFRTAIPRDPTFLKASVAGVPIGLLSRRPSDMARLFEDLAREVEARLELGLSDDEPLPLVD